MRKYFDNLLIYGGGILAFLTFFKNDFPAFWGQLSNMSGRTLLLTLSIIAVVVGVIMKWLDHRVTLGNIKSKIRKSLDDFNVSHCIVPWEAWYFRYDITFWGQRFMVGRPKGGSYLYIELRTAVLPEHATAYEALPAFDKRKLGGEIALEIARARIFFNRHKDDYSDFSITTTLPITSKLRETDFFNTLVEVYHGAMLVLSQLMPIACLVQAQQRWMLQSFSLSQ
jgi:hypothetical protein